METNLKEYRHLWVLWSPSRQDGQLGRYAVLLRQDPLSGAWKVSSTWEGQFDEEILTEFRKCWLEVHQQVSALAKREFIRSFNKPDGSLEDWYFKPRRKPIKL